MGQKNKRKKKKMNQKPTIKSVQSEALQIDNILDELSEQVTTVNKDVRTSEPVKQLVEEVLQQVESVLEPEAPEIIDIEGPVEKTNHRDVEIDSELRRTVTVQQPVSQVPNSQAIAYQQPVAQMPQQYVTVQQPVAQVPRPQAMAYQQPVAQMPQQYVTVQQPVSQVPNSQAVAYQQPVAQMPQQYVTVQQPVAQVPRSQAVAYQQPVVPMSQQYVTVQQPVSQVPRQQAASYQQSVQPSVVQNPQPQVVKQPEQIEMIEPQKPAEEKKAPTPKVEREELVTKRKTDLLIMDSPKSSFSEAIKSIRTNLQFAAVDKEIKVILVTSPEPGDGKSLISCNLAGAYAQENKKVLIIDCDLRKGRQAEIFGVKKLSTTGYTNLILNYIESVETDSSTNMHQELKDYIIKTDINNVDLIPNGPTPPNPIELLASDKNKELLQVLRKMYDVIILDCPPVLGLSDTLIMTKYSDANIVAISKGKTKVELLAEVKKNFEKVNSAITGVVINKAQQKHNSYYGYYGDH